MQKKEKIKNKKINQIAVGLDAKYEKKSKSIIGIYSVLCTLKEKRDEKRKVARFG